MRQVFGEIVTTRRANPSRNSEDFAKIFQIRSST